MTPAQQARDFAQQHNLVIFQDSENRRRYCFCPRGQYHPDNLPKSFASFPRLLAAMEKYVGVASLESAHRAMVNSAVIDMADGPDMTAVAEVDYATAEKRILSFMAVENPQNEVLVEVFEKMSKGCTTGRWSGKHPALGMGFGTDVTRNLWVLRIHGVEVFSHESRDAVVKFARQINNWPGDRKLRNKQHRVIERRYAPRPT